MTTTTTLVNARKFSSLWLPVFLLFSGLMLAGCSSTEAPVVESIDTPDELEAGETGTFEATLPNQEDATKPITYSWEFGDGSTGSGLLTNYSYNSSGEYTVKFRASNEGGADSASATVNVVRAPEPAQVTSLNANPNPVDVGEEVKFSTNVQGDSPISYDWSFGEGTRASGESPTHTFDRAGEYTTRLEVSNEVGEDSRSVTVRVERALPSICTSVSEFNAAFFGRNSSTLTDEARSSLQENADILSKCPNLSVDVEGFAAPGERSPESLSSDRAQAVVDFYSENGVDSDRITSGGEGAVSGVTSKKGGTRSYRRADSIPQR